MAPFPTKHAAFPRWFRAMAFALALTPGLGWGSLTWESKQIHQDAKPVDKEVVGVFLFKNTGATPVTIRDIRSSCSCTVGELAQRTYAPGEGGSIKAIFTVAGRTGRQEKALTVTTDDPLAPTVTLNLLVDIEEVLALSTRVLNWKIGGVPEEQFVEVNALGQNRITTLELKNTSPKELAKVRIVPVEPGLKYRLFIQPVAATQPQTVTLTFVAHFEGEAQRTFALFALAR